MSVKIILMSDSHTNTDAIERVRQRYRDADLLVHCGDFLVSPERLNGFVAVAGNLDRAEGVSPEEILNIGAHRIWVTHGHRYIQGDSPELGILSREAKKRGCTAVFFGHTHQYCDETVRGIRLLNPGSVWKSRDANQPRTLMEVTINGSRIEAEPIRYVTLEYEE